jgi:hypothetical protein
LVQTEPGFPVDVVGTTELHATFRFVVFSQGKPHLAAFIAPP